MPKQPIWAALLLLVSVTTAKTPHICDQVRLDDVNRTYFVIAVDETQGSVSLLPVSGLTARLDGVPMTKLRLPPMQFRKRRFEFRDLHREH